MKKNKNGNKTIFVYCVVVVVSFFFLLILPSCNLNEDENKLAEAQSCLDTSSGSEVDECLSIISGVEGEPAEKLRCVAGFVKQGFDDPERFVKIFEEMEKSDESADGSAATLGAITILCFNSQDEINITLNHCRNSGSSAYAKLAYLSKIATDIASVGFLLDGLNPGEVPNLEEMSQVLNDILNDPDHATKEANLATIGDTALLIQDSCKNENSSDFDEDLCKNIDDALVGVDLNNPSDVGEALASYLEQP